jgi:hypothetical protein
MEGESDYWGTGPVAAFGGLRRPSPASFPGVGDFWKRLLVSFSGLGVGAGRLGLRNYETQTLAPGTGQIGVSRRRKLNREGQFPFMPRGLGCHR